MSPKWVPVAKFDAKVVDGKVVSSKVTPTTPPAAPKSTLRIPEKKRAQYVRLLLARDRAITAVNRASVDLSQFFIEVQDEFDVPFYPFDIEANDGTIVAKRIPPQQPEQPSS